MRFSGDDQSFSADPACVDAEFTYHDVNGPDADGQFRDGSHNGTYSDQPDGLSDGLNADDAVIDPVAYEPAGPRIRRGVSAFYVWRSAPLGFFLSLFAIAPFVAAALGAPALLSLAPTVDMLAPMAAARAIAAGAAPIQGDASPLYSLLLILSDRYADTPGGAFLTAKAIAAAISGGLYALIASRRMPTAWTILSSAALAAYVAAPFSGAAEMALAIFATLAVLLFTAPALDTRMRALREGVLAGALLFILWASDPAFAAAGVAALIFCPFWSGRFGLRRYGATIVSTGAFLLISDTTAPGFVMARIDAVMLVGADLGAALALIVDGSTATSAAVLSGAGGCTILILAAVYIFGGAAARCAWLGGFVFLALSLAAAHLAGAQTAPLFIVAAAIAVFSITSPFYHAIWQVGDRAAVSLAGVTAALTFFWAAALLVQVSGQFTLQSRTAAAAPADIRATFGLVQPGGPTIAHWIEEGRFSTPEARELFALTPVDQSTMLLEAVAQARMWEENGLDVAILTAADTACLLSTSRSCRANGQAAADFASVVLVPRLDIDATTAAVKAKAEVLLYTEFKLAEKSPLWEVWVRRGVGAPM